VKRVVQREVKGDAAKMKGVLHEEKRLAAAKVESESEDEASLEQLLSVEDLAALPVKAQSLVEKDEESESAEEAETTPPVPGEEPQMLNPSLRAALSKQGYRLLGSHSGVKLCRWTKSMLRGRGGCYKHTFYGLFPAFFVSFKQESPRSNAWR
jgi:tRNA wybutosine-synthesizing protein 1